MTYYSKRQQYFGFAIQVLAIAHFLKKQNDFPHRSAASLAFDIIFSAAILFSTLRTIWDNKFPSIRITDGKLAYREYSFFWKVHQIDLRDISIAQFGTILGKGSKLYYFQVGTSSESLKMYDLEQAKELWNQLQGQLRPGIGPSQEAWELYSGKEKRGRIESLVIIGAFCLIVFFF
jgi:hypothetical protein